jgi:ABC-type transport system involved in cytochrome c biogenesis permease subunit
MAIKYTILGIMIYATIAVWLAAAIAYMLRLNRTGTGLFAVGFAIMLAAFGLRWEEAQHLPMQSLFEVFICLGVVMFPLWLFCRKCLGARGPAVTAVIGVIVLFPAGFIFKAEPQKLPPALQSWLFAPHVAAYMLSYIIMIMAAAQAIMQLAGGEGEDADGPRQYELATWRMVRLGFPLLLLGLVLGAVWGKLAWGDYWGWDPKELWSLASVLVYVGYLHFRALFGARYSRVNAILAICGAAFIIITLLWVNLAAKIFPGMHTYAS